MGVRTAVFHFSEHWGETTVCFDFTGGPMSHVVRLEFEKDGAGYLIDNRLHRYQPTIAQCHRLMYGVLDGDDERMGLLERYDAKRE